MRKIPFTQSREWEKFQRDLGEETLYERRDNFEFLAIIKNTPIGKYLFLPYGPIFETKTAWEEAYVTLMKYAKKIGAFFIRVEPQNPDFTQYVPSNARKVKDINPLDTWVLDLTPEEDVILVGFSHTLRTISRTYGKKGITIEVSHNPSDIDYLVDLQNRLFKKKHLSAYSKKYLATELAQPFASLYLARFYQPTEQITIESTLPKDGQVIAASLFFDYQGTRYYMQSAADERYRKLPATAALLINSIMDAKGRGITEFDFWGIAPEGAAPDHPWAGFTEFKKSFGGESRHYAGTYDIVLSRSKYALYQKLKKIKK